MADTTITSVTVTRHAPSSTMRFGHLSALIHYTDGDTSHELTLIAGGVRTQRAQAVIVTRWPSTWTLEVRGDLAKAEAEAAHKLSGKWRIHGQLATPPLACTVAAVPRETGTTPTTVDEAVAILRDELGQFVGDIGASSSWDEAAGVWRWRWEPCSWDDESVGDARHEAHKALGDTVLEAMCNLVATVRLHRVLVPVPSAS